MNSKKCTTPIKPNKIGQMTIDGLKREATDRFSFSFLAVSSMNRLFVCLDKLLFNLTQDGVVFERVLPDHFNVRIIECLYVSWYSEPS